jgi:putative hydrolase of the HAD superfamily
MPIRVVLFDLDNTIYPASSGIMQHIDRRIGEYVQQHLGLSETAAHELRRFYFTTYGTTLRGLQAHYQNIEPEHYLRFVHDIAIEALLEYDAALDAALARLPTRKAIFTNAPLEHAERVLGALELAHHFERIFDLRCFQFAPKPHPSCYQYVLNELGIDGTEALLLEDSPRNLPPAKVLGITTLLISETRHNCPDADYQVADVLSALEIAQTLTKSRCRHSYPRDHHAAGTRRSDRATYSRKQSGDVSKSMLKKNNATQ